VTGLHIDFHGDILKTFSAPVTETAFFYFEGGPPSDYYDSAEKCLRTWAEKADGLHSWAIGTTYEDVEEESIKGKAVVLSLGWQTKEHHVEFNKTDLCKEHGKALVSSSKKLTAWYVRITSSRTSRSLLMLLQARQVLEVSRVIEYVQSASGRSICVLFSTGQTAIPSSADTMRLDRLSEGAMRAL